MKTQMHTHPINQGFRLGAGLAVVCRVQGSSWRRWQWWEIDDSDERDDANQDEQDDEDVVDDDIDGDE